MSIIVYCQEYETDIDNLKESIASEMEECAKQIREGKPECRLYLGGTVYAHLDFADEVGVTVEA